MPQKIELISLVNRKTWQRRSNLKHGARARTILLPDEKSEDFFALLEDAFALYQPKTARDTSLAMDVVNSRWFLLRRQRAYDSFDYELCSRKGDASHWTPAERRKLRLLDQYKIAAERAWGRALKNADYIGMGTRRGAKSALRPWEEWYQIQREKCRGELLLAAA